MVLNIRCATMPDGNIEACVYLDLSRRLVIDVRSGAVIDSNVEEGTDDFRLLVREARKYKAL
jgi:hypothetical protein